MLRQCSRSAARSVRARPRLGASALLRVVARLETPTCARASAFATARTSRAAAPVNPLTGGGGVSSSPPAADVAPTPTTAVGSVLVKLSGDTDADFASVSFFSGDTVADLAQRAARECGWRALPGRLRLFPVRPDCARRVERGDEAEGVGGALFSGDSLDAAGVADRAFLLARAADPPPAEAAPAARGAEDVAGALQRARLAPAPLNRTREASGFALDGEGLDEPVGWALAAATFLPVGRVSAELGAAASDAEGAGAARADFDVFFARLQLENALVLSRALSKVGESAVQDVWDADVRRWWPDVVEAGGAFSSVSVRPERLPTALVISRSCRVDYCRVVSLRGGQAHAVVAVGELKSTLYGPLDGVPQALVAAFNAAVDLRAKGLPAAQCVVPFVSNTGALEQHGVAYLLEPCFPCAVLTTPVLDLTDADGRRRVAAARWALRRVADETARLVRALAPPRDAPPLEPALDLAAYHVKRPLPFVGRSVEHSVLHQLRVFERLRRSPAAEHVVLPAAVLMRHPVEAAAAPGGAGGPAAGVTWAPALAVAFPRLAGFATGVPLPGAEHREAVLRALRDALRAVHRAGVVHLDLFSGNVLWRATAAADGGGAGGVEVRLVDFDAALESGQAVPEAARGVVERNGHVASYDPDLFAEGAVARPAFDWWHFALLADDAAPFGKGEPAAPGALAAWLRGEGRVARVRERVAAELAGEAAAEAAAAAEAGEPRAA